MNYLQLHLDYLFSKVFFYITVALLLIIQGSVVYNSMVVEGFSYLDAFRNQFGYDFLNESFMVSEFVLVFLAILIGINLSSKANQGLMAYSVSSKQTKRHFILARMMSGIITILILVLFNQLFIYSFTIVFTPYQINLVEYLRQSGLLFLEALAYLLMTMVFNAIVQHFMIGFIPIMMFWTIKVTSQNLSQEVNKLIDIFTININGYLLEEKNILFFIIIYIFIQISYIIIVIKKDC